jgi:hypothetical protein
VRKSRNVAGGARHAGDETCAHRIANNCPRSRKLRSRNIRHVHDAEANRPECDPTRRPRTHSVDTWKSSAEHQREFGPARCDIGTRAEEASDPKIALSHNSVRALAHPALRCDSLDVPSVMLSISPSRTQRSSARYTSCDTAIPRRSQLGDHVDPSVFRNTPKASPGEKTLVQAFSDTVGVQAWSFMGVNDMLATVGSFLETVTAVVASNV